jgi:sulfur carrier protein ThiS
LRKRKHRENLEQDPGGHSQDKDMKVRVRFFAYFRDVFGGKEKEVNLPQEATVMDLLNTLADSARRFAA